MSATHMPTHASLSVTDQDHYLVSQLLKSELFTQFQEAFQITTGLPLSLRAAGSSALPMEGATNVCPFGQMLTENPSSRAALQSAQASAEEAAAAAPLTSESFAGLQHSLVPVILGQRTVGFLQTGWVFFRKPSKTQFTRVHAALAAAGAQFDEAALRSAYGRTRVLPKAHYTASVRLVVAFAKHLALVANKLVMETRTTEHPNVARARAFIAQHLREEVSLELVARSVGMSPFHFCKVFKANVGITYTDYVARARIEQVKHSMLNPHVRVSEAAFNAGFQSLSQFNRVFRRVVGESPRVYREQLHRPLNGRN